VSRLRAWRAQSVGIGGTAGRVPNARSGAFSPAPQRAAMSLEPVGAQPGCAGLKRYKKKIELLPMSQPSPGSRSC
jgi:hypothetical protein